MPYLSLVLVVLPILDRSIQGLSNQATNARVGPGQGLGQHDLDVRTTALVLKFHSNCIHKRIRGVSITSNFAR